MSWKETLENEFASGGGRFTWEWYENHTITQQLLHSGYLKGEVCDVACGIGRRAKVLSKLTALRFSGVDYDPWAIEFAQQDIWTECHADDFLRGSFYDLPYESHRFDTVLFLAALEHAAFPTHALKELCRITRPGGCVLISITENNYHADPDHKSSVSHAGLVRYLKTFGRVTSWVADHILYAALFPDGDASSPVAIGDLPRVIYVDDRSEDTYTDQWDAALRDRTILFPVDCDRMGMLSPSDQERILAMSKMVDVIHFGTSALRISSDFLDQLKAESPNLLLSKWWGDVCPNRYVSECEALSAWYDVIFLSVSNYVGQCSSTCTQIHINSPAIVDVAEQAIPFEQRPWDIGLFANGYTEDRLARMRMYIPFESRQVIWYGDGSPLGRISRMATNRIIGLTRSSVNLIDPSQQVYRHWFSARVSNALAYGCIALSSNIDSVDVVLGDLIRLVDDTPEAWRDAIDETFAMESRDQLLDKSKRGQQFARQYLSYPTTVETMIRAWGFRPLNLQSSRTGAVGT